MNVINFFISHIGWFVGAFFIALFAIVGYFADKKDKESNSKKVDDKNNNVTNNDVSDIYSINNNSVESASVSQDKTENVAPVVQESVSTKNSNVVPMGGVDSIEGFYDGLDVSTEESTEPADYSINVDGSNNFENNSSDLEWSGSETESKEAVISEAPVESTNVSEEKSIDDSLSFESINMTFEDLEKKDFDIINDSVGVTDSDDGFISDYNADDLDFFDNFSSVVQDNNIVQENNIVEDSNVAQDNNIVQDNNLNVNLSNEIFNSDSSTLNNFDELNSNNVFDVAVDSSNSFNDSSNNFTGDSIQFNNNSIDSSNSSTGESIQLDNNVVDSIVSDKDDSDEIWSL